MDRVKSQAAVVSQLLFDPKTGSAYKDVLVLTGQIIKETAFLIWLLICSVFVFAAWFGDVAIGAGRKARTWWQTQQSDTTEDGNQAAAATGKALLDVSQNGASFLLDKAREQLGLEKIERPAKANISKPAKPAAKKPPVAAAVAKSVADIKSPESKTVSEASAAEKP